MKQLKDIPTYFFIVLLGVVFYLSYLVFKPFFAVVILSAVFASSFYPIYQWIRDKICRGNESVGSLLSVFVFVLIILIPLSYFGVLLAGETVDSINDLQNKIQNGDFKQTLDQGISGFEYLRTNYFGLLGIDSGNLQEIILNTGRSLQTGILSGLGFLFDTTASFFINLFFLLITMYYLFKDGRRFVQRVMFLTPFPEKYDSIIVEKFREVSRSTIIGSLITAAAQGLLSMIAYLIIGVPVLFLGAATALASFIPIIGTALVWVPVSIILAITGNWIGAIFLVVYGTFVISLSDNLIRTWVIQGQSKIHPLLIFFSILGGISAFGLLGIIFGPLVLTILLTLLHIYSLEYKSVLKK